MDARGRTLVVLMIAIGGPAAWCQNLGSLKNVSVPKAPNLERYVRDQDALIALGKALFWDMQVGSDGRVACATCHFHAGADHRVQNQLFNPLDSFRPNYTLTPKDFPFHMLSNVEDNRSTLLRDTVQAAGSAGVFRRMFSDLGADGISDDGFDAGDAPAFSVGGINVRQVTGRNTPTAINAVFYFRNFWDGRASNIFTGLTPFGDSDPRPNVLAESNGQLTAERVRLENSSLASQAVGPPMSSVEMSYDGRTWPKLGKRILALRPLALQKVAPDDSVLGPFAGREGRGLLPEHTYLGFVQAAFQPQYWRSSELVAAAPASGSRDFTQAEFNFALFFGLAIQAYEATLVSDDSRFDRFSEGDGGALTVLEQAGLRVFQGSGRCTFCHVGPEFSGASFTSVLQRGAVQPARNGTVADTGFFRTGVRPIAADSGLDARDDFGKPFSVAAVQNAGASLGIRGAFKTPTLRNVEFTGPFFHNGGQATLEQVVEFYNRGGDYIDDGNLGRGIRRLNLSSGDRAALVAFMKSLSDDRVRFERAPFDHPELCVPAGHMEILPNVLQPQSADPRFRLSAADKWAAVPVVGRRGNAAPLQTFDELLIGAGADGSRAHTMTEACTVP
ncbi:MAG: cytochrome C peroxidase [Acidobacteria bacterium]|nr:cytochrome C peroxidase [Acidobacteriota bacterium]